MTELKPCPFCGARGMIAATLDDQYRPMCMADGCIAMDGHSNRSDAVAAWNVRQSQTTDQIEGMGEALYTLSAQLAMTNWMVDDVNCAIYERVVKQWQAMCDA